MKNLLKSFLLAAAALMLFAGCNNLGSGDATVDSLAYNGTGCILSISVDNLNDELLDTTSAYKSARTINPTSLEDDASIISSFLLKGTSLTSGAALGTSGNGIPVTFTANTANSNRMEAQVAIPYGSWELTLQARDVAENVLLQGKTFANLKTLNSTVVFTLTTDGVTTTGNLNLRGTFTDAQGVAKSYKAGLYDIFTGDLVGAEKFANVAATSPKFTFTEEDNVAPGRYSFQVRFYNVELASGATAIPATAKQVGYYEDIVVIAPGRTTAPAGVIDCGSIINQRPASPRNLRAFLKANSDTAGNYSVILTWDDNSNNEENFVITIDEYAGTAADATKTTYRVLGIEEADPSDADDKREVFFASSLNGGDISDTVPGSVRASSTAAIIKLPYGKIFDVSIQAQNFVGLSDFDADTDGLQVCTRVNTDPSAGADDSQYKTTRINRLRIKYNLDGGTLTIPAATAGDPATNVTGTYYEYKNIYSVASTALSLAVPASGPQPALIAIAAADADGKHLIKDTYQFKKWTKVDGTDFASTDTLTYQGVDVKAVYNTQTLVAYKIDDKYATISAKAYYGSVAAANDITNGSVVATANSDLIFTVEPPTGKTVDEVNVVISNGQYQERRGGILGDSYTYTGTAELERGVHTVNVKAHIDGEPAEKIYAFTFTITLADN